MASISLCMIVKDEKEVLDRCLTGAKKLVDEIIIVDTGSKDGTEKIAEKYNTSEEDLIRLNHLELIHPGEKLLIKK